MVKKGTKNAIQKLKKARHIQADDTQSVNYNGDVNIDDLTTVGYTSDAEIEYLSDAEAVNYADNNTANSVAQQQAKRIIKKYKNLKTKATKDFDQTRKKKINEADDVVVFVKQVPIHPRNILARAIRK